MHSDIQDQMHELEELRLPELQARSAEIVGEHTRTPNKQYLLRRIAEVLEAKQAEGRTKSDDAGEHTDHDDVTTEPESTDDDDVGEPTTTTDLAAHRPRVAGTLPADYRPRHSVDVSGVIMGRINATLPRPAS